MPRCRDASDPGCGDADPGLAVLVPHAVVLVGQLPGRDLCGTGEWHLRRRPGPPVQHNFMVTGAVGSPCDSVDVLDVSYLPFDPDRLLLTSFNGSMALFPYPGFILLDANGDDTLGIEPVDCFGLAGTTVHDPERSTLKGPFSGT